MADLSRCINDVQERRKLVHIVYKSHDLWPLAPGLDHDETTEKPTRRDLRISVLDSSFNPPTLAHLALARSRPPNSLGVSNSSGDYDARLLLLSVRNADKGAPKPGEATYVHRLEMMILLAKELEGSSSGTEPSPTGRNVAVAIIDEPTFVRKSTVLRQYLHDLTGKLDAATLSDGAAVTIKSNDFGKGFTNAHGKQIKLSFIMGFDTLERFLAPCYYNNALTEMHEALRQFFALPPDGDGSEVACAWRGQKGSDMVAGFLQANAAASETREDTPETLSVAQPLIASGCISFIPLSEREMSLSSTEVRSKRQDGLSDWRMMVPHKVGGYIEKLGLYTRIKEN